MNDIGNGYIKFNNGIWTVQALKELKPEFFSAKNSINGNYSNSNFGISFPKIAKKGDIFVRVDISPNRVYKFEGDKWIEINKNVTQSYLYDKQYMQYLIEKINSGEYDPELLTENEKMEIEEYLKGTQNS